MKNTAHKQPFILEDNFLLQHPNPPQNSVTSPLLAPKLFLKIIFILVEGINLRVATQFKTLRRFGTIGVRIRRYIYSGQFCTLSINFISIN